MPVIYFPTPFVVGNPRCRTLVGDVHLTPIPLSMTYFSTNNQRFALKSRPCWHIGIPPTTHLPCQRQGGGTKSLGGTCFPLFQDRLGLPNSLFSFLSGLDAPLKGPGACGGARGRPRGAAAAGGCPGRAAEGMCPISARGKMAAIRDETFHPK